jgi:hypothetical protein
VVNSYFLFGCGLDLSAFCFLPFPVPISELREALRCFSPMPHDTTTVSSGADGNGFFIRMFLPSQRPDERILAG